MGLVLATLTAASALSPVGDGDAIVALAWWRQRRVAHAPSACIEPNTPSTADLIRDRPYRYLRVTVGTDGPNATPDQQRLQRIAKGEGRTPAIDLTVLALPEPSPACKNRYRVSAPAIIDDHAYIVVEMSCGLMCGGGEILALERRGGAWQVVAPLVEFVV